MVFHVVLYSIASYLLYAVIDQLPRLGKRELVFLLLFTCSFVVFVSGMFLFPLVLGMGCAILLWHSLGLGILLIILLHIESKSAHLSQRLARQAYSIPLLKYPSVLLFIHSFKHLLLHHLANQSLILCWTSMGRGNKSVSSPSVLHDKDSFIKFYKLGARQIYRASVYRLLILSFLLLSSSVPNLPVLEMGLCRHQMELNSGTKRSTLVMMDSNCVGRADIVRVRGLGVVILQPVRR